VKVISIRHFFAMQTFVYAHSTGITFYAKLALRCHICLILSAVPTKIQLSNFQGFFLSNANIQNKEEE